MNFRIIITIIFLIFFSCKTRTYLHDIEPTIKTTEKDGKPFLKHIRIGLLEGINQELYYEKYKLKIKTNDTENLNNVYIEEKLIISIYNDLETNYIFEIFNESHLLISEYINRGAAETAQMKRVNTYIIKLDKTDDIFFLKLNEIRICMNKIHLAEYSRRPATQFHTFSITDINDEKISLFSNKSESISFDLMNYKKRIIGEKTY